MKIVSVLLLSLLVSLAISAQEIIKRDTINLRGYVFDSKGKPFKYLTIKSTQHQADYSDYNFTINTQTDTNGYFELKGIKPFDTLKMIHVLFDTLTYLNKGSRYMVIYLPPEKTIDISSEVPVQITVKRLHKKTIAIYKPKPFNGCILFVEVHRLPQYKNQRLNTNTVTGKETDGFIDDLKTNIKYPPQAVANNIEGTVQLEFTVNKDGSVSNFQLLKGIGYGCDEKVIAAIKKTSYKWRPAINNGMHFNMNESVTIEFKLTDK